MNIIVIVSDTFRRDHLGCYGNRWIHTPNLDKLAGESMVFDRAYAASFPTVPNRADVMTGRFTFTYFDWSPLPRDQVVMAEVLSEAGYATMMVADTPHFLKDGYNFDRGFSGWHWVRGQENDRWMTDPIEVELPCAPHKLRSPEGAVKQYLRNVSQRKSEADYFVAQTMSVAAEWLERNRKQKKFFLYIDTFDPHEPWDPPQWYVDLYDPNYRGEEVIYPVYGPCDYLAKRELKHVRALYAGEVTLVDRWVGRLLRKVEDLGLLDDTAIFFTTDHGFYHGEHGLIGKSIITPKYHSTTPLYEEVARIPLLVRMPDGKGRRSNALVQPPDLMPTILELAKAKAPGTMQGKSMVPLLEGKKCRWRNMAVSTWSLAHDPSTGRQSTVTSGSWSLVYSGSPGEGKVAQKTAAVDSVSRSIRLADQRFVRTQLYHLPSDPGQKRNVIAKNRDVAKRLHARYVKLLEELGMAEEYVRHRRKM